MAFETIGCWQIALSALFLLHYFIIIIIWYTYFRTKWSQMSRSQGRHLKHSTVNFFILNILKVYYFQLHREVSDLVR